jgi:hypothetical protein
MIGATGRKSQGEDKIGFKPNQSAAEKPPWTSQGFHPACFNPIGGYQDFQTTIKQDHRMPAPGALGQAAVAIDTIPAAGPLGISAFPNLGQAA